MRVTSPASACTYKHIEYMCSVFLLHTNCFTGEGMKVGALALLRSERTVCVKTSSDMWSFGLKRHSVLQEEVLTVFVTSE